MRRFFTQTLPSPLESTLTWTRSWCSCSVATDASENGHGVCLKECEKAVCQTIGRTSQRARFRKCRTNDTGARTALLDYHRLGFDTGGGLIDWMKSKMRLLTRCSSPLIIFRRCRSKLLKPVVGKMSPQDSGDIKMKTLYIVLESRALTRGIETLASTHQLYRKRCVALVNNNMSAALSFERRRSRNSLQLTCIRKLAGLCLALVLAVPLRWIPSEVNMSDRPSRIHDPSNIRDEAVTHFLTTVLKSMTNRDKLDAGTMVQRCHRRTNLVTWNRNGVSSRSDGHGRYIGWNRSRALKGH